jgi:hypothetical protein
LDTDRLLEYAVIIVVVIFVATLTYFTLARVYVTHPGDAYVSWFFAPGIITWPPYFDLIHARSIFGLFTNSSLGYGDPGAPVRVLIIYNPFINLDAGFVVNNTQYIIKTSGEGIVRYDVVFNIQSFSTIPNPSLQDATLLVGSVAQCIYGVNRTLALRFLVDVSHEVLRNATVAVGEFTNESFVSNLVSSEGLSLNITQCLVNYSNVIRAYQLSIPIILSSFFIPSAVAPGSLGIHQPFLVVIGYNARNGVLTSAVNNVDLVDLVNNLLTRDFLYSKSSIIT